MAGALIKKKKKQLLIDLNQIKIDKTISDSLINWK